MKYIIPLHNCITRICNLVSLIRNHNTRIHKLEKQLRFTSFRLLESTHFEGRGNFTDVSVNRHGFNLSGSRGHAGAASSKGGGKGKGGMVSDKRGETFKRLLLSGSLARLLFSSFWTAA